MVYCLRDLWVDDILLLWIKTHVIFFILNNLSSLKCLFIILNMRKCTKAIAPSLSHHVRKIAESSPVHGLSFLLRAGKIATVLTALILILFAYLTAKECFGEIGK